MATAELSVDCCLLSAGKITQNSFAWENNVELNQYDTFMLKAWGINSFIISFIRLYQHWLSVFNHLQLVSFKAMIASSNLLHIELCRIGRWWKECWWKPRLTQTRNLGRKSSNTFPSTNKIRLQRCSAIFFSSFHNNVNNAKQYCHYPSCHLVDFGLGLIASCTMMLSERWTPAFGRCRCTTASRPYRRSPSH